MSAIFFILGWAQWGRQKLNAILAHDRSQTQRRDPAVRQLSKTHCDLSWAKASSWPLNDWTVSEVLALAITKDRNDHAETLFGFMAQVVYRTQRYGFGMVRYGRPDKPIDRVLEGTSISKSIARSSVAVILILGGSSACPAAATAPQREPIHRLAPLPALPAAPEPLQIAQAPTQPPRFASAPSFDAASVKAVPEGYVVQCEIGPDHFPCTNLGPRMVNAQRFRAMTDVSSLIQWAYGVREFCVLGVPERFRTQHFEIQATADKPVNEAEMRQMVQSLLAERFHLKLHREMREIPIYALVVGKDGPKLAPTKNLVAESQGNISIGPGQLSATNAVMALFARILTDNLERPVVDRTNLIGHYDFRLTWDPSSGGAGIVENGVYSPIGAAVFGSIQEVGLQLEPKKEPTEVLVINSVEMPSEN